MRRVTLLSLFVVLLVAQMFGLDLSLGPGLSVKNAYLYVLLIVLVVEFAVTKREDIGHERRLGLLGVHVPFILLICYAIVSWAFFVYVDTLSFEYEVIDPRVGMFKKTDRIKGSTD